MGWVLPNILIKNFWFLYLQFIYHNIWQGLVWHMGSFSCGMWDLVLWPRNEPGAPALQAQTISHWTTREVPTVSFNHWNWPSWDEVGIKQEEKVLQNIGLSINPKYNQILRENIACPLPAFCL